MQSHVVFGMCVGVCVTYNLVQCVSSVWCFFKKIYGVVCGVYDVIM